MRDLKRLPRELKDLPLAAKDFLAAMVMSLVSAALFNEKNPDRFFVATVVVMLLFFFKGFYDLNQEKGLGEAFKLFTGLAQTAKEILIADEETAAHMP